MNKLRVLLAVAAAAMLSGCVSIAAPVVPPIGGIYTDIKAPLDINAGKQNDGVLQVEGLKTGESKAQYLYIPFTYGLLSFSWGDGSLEQSMKAGGLDSLEYADYRFFQVLGVYAESTFYVHGK
jgi:hypothetical protein